jgi:predicted nucleic acid-binding protein
MGQNGEPKILLDCDVVIHFLKGGKIMELPTIFPDRFVMLDKVHNELMKRNSNILAIGVFLAASKVPVIPMPTNADILKEYFSLKRQMDDGEAACLAVAKFRKEYVASSNITQIKVYCQQNGIVYYTTMDLLQEATVKKIMTDDECKEFIREVKSRGSRLPCDSMPEFRKMKR